MDFITSIKTCFIKYVDFTGRASRPEYWYFFLFTFVIKFCADIIDSGLAGQTYWSYLDQITYGPVWSIVSILVFLPSIAVSVRRMHDINRSGWWLLIIFTIIGLIPLIYWLCKKSNQDENHFGVFKTLAAYGLNPNERVIRTGNVILLKNNEGTFSIHNGGWGGSGSIILTNQRLIYFDSMRADVVLDLRDINRVTVGWSDLHIYTKNREYSMRFGLLIRKAGWKTDILSNKDLLKVEKDE